MSDGFSQVQKPFKRVPSSLPIICRKVKPRQKKKKYWSLVTSIKKKHFITKLSSTSYIFGFYVKKYLGPALKAHMFKKPFTTVKLDWSFSNGIGLQPLSLSYIWTYKRLCSTSWNYVTHFIYKGFYCDLLILKYLFMGYQ